MARPALPDAAAILALADGQGMVTVRVSANASADAILLPTDDGPLVIRTTATPEQGKANDAVLRLLAKALDRPVSALDLARGAHQRTKRIRIAPPQRR